MWSPRSYRHDDPAALRDLIRAHPFGLLVSAADGKVTGTHLPFMIDEDGTGFGTLVGHMARANPHWKSWTPDTEVMVCFLGPHSYISPAWYVERVTVPTWNYAAVHAYGRPALVHDPVELRPMVERLTRMYEPEPDSDWSLAEAEPVMGPELQAIVGFRIPVERWDGKFKFNQNRSEDDQRGVVRALSASADPVQRAVATIMRANLAGAHGSD